MKLAVPHAIVFVLDPNHKGVEVPKYSGLVSHSNTCVSVGTQADMDGETDVTLDRDLNGLLNCVFEGEIHTPTGSIAVVTSGILTLARLDGLEATTRFSVWVDDVKWPSRVSVVVPR